MNCQVKVELTGEAKIERKNEHERRLILSVVATAVLLLAEALLAGTEISPPRIGLAASFGFRRKPPKRKQQTAARG